MPEFKWINTVLGNLKTSLSGSYHAFAFRKYGALCLAAFTYRFNRRFDLRTLPTRLLVAAADCAPRPLPATRSADARQSRDPQAEGSNPDHTDPGGFNP